MGSHATSSTDPEGLACPTVSPGEYGLILPGQGVPGASGGVYARTGIQCGAGTIPVQGLIVDTNAHTCGGISVNSKVCMIEALITNQGHASDPNGGDSLGMTGPTGSGSGSSTIRVYTAF
jgi:hypothetical protein